MYYLKFADLYNKKSEFLTSGIVLDYLGKAMSVIDANTFFKSHDSITQSRKITSNDIINFSMKLLSSPVSSLQLSAYHVLRLLIPKLVEQDKILLDGEKAKELNITRFKEILSSTQNIVNSMLMGFR